MSTDHHPAPPMKDADADATNRKAARGPEQALKCPRCDSPNTKFCYYNNYSLTQPRHFCKTCRRYWTKGGALRNVPIGGGCRKNKKIKSSASSSSSVRLSDSSLFHSPAMDFHLGGGLSSASGFRLHHSAAAIYSNQFPSSSSSSGLVDAPYENSLMGANYAPPVLGGAIHQVINNNSGGGGGNSLASSIESLSCINQDLHWKLQQQRLGMLLGTNKDCTADTNSEEQQKQNLMMQPILFQNLDISSKPTKEGGEGATEWFFGNSYATANNGGDQGLRTAGDWSGGGGVQGWSTTSHDMHHHNHYNALP